jgi:hypothetical protein
MSRTASDIHPFETAVPSQSFVGAVAIPTAPKVNNPAPQLCRIIYPPKHRSISGRGSDFNMDK